MLDPYRPKAPSQEIALLDTVRRLGKSRANRIGVCIHLSNLTPNNKREHYIRIATEIFIHSVSAFEGQFFRLHNDDLVFLAKGISFERLDNAVNRIRVLFIEDPLTQYESSAEGAKRFCTWYDFEHDYEPLLEKAYSLLNLAEEYVRKQELDTPIDSDLLVAPIRLEMLFRLEQALERIDITNIVRRQTVCSVIDGLSPEPLFDEMFVSIEDLQTITTPGFNLCSNKWLFQYLTSALDKRVMAMLIRDGIQTERPFSLNLNVDTVLSPDFGRFESVITPQLRGRLVIEMNKIDVFADMGAFLFARDYLHDKGFRICLDGLTHHTLPYYDRERLGFDLIKIYWTPGSIDEMKQEMMPTVRNIVMEAGQSRTILCRCDSEQAIKIGQSLGIVMFQGRHVEGLLNINKRLLLN